MAEEHGITKNVVLAVICLLIAVGGLAYLDLSREKTEEPEQKLTYELTSEVHIDSLGQVKVFSQDYSSATCERMNDQHNCTAWVIKNYMKVPAKEK